MSLGFSYIGLIWLLMLFIPNLIWTKNKPKDYEDYVKKESRVLLVFERVGQLIVTPVALMFSDFNFKGLNFWCGVLAVSFLCMVLYEVFWMRYFRSEKTMRDYYRSILGIPVAGATLPVIAFFLLGIYGGNALMLVGTLILGVGHIGIHLRHRREVYGSQEKKKLPVRIASGVAKVIGTLVLAAFAGASTLLIAGRNANQLKHAIRYRNGVNDQIYVQLNDQEEYVSIIGEDRSNPVVISLHGGPGSASTFVDYCWQDYLTDKYTFISWDERGCGRSYYRNADVDPNNQSLSFDSQLSDLDALVDYACDRFGQDQVIIMGHSYGSMLGSRYALSHPEKVSAYIGIGQVVNASGYANESYSYEDGLAKARANGDDTTEMEASYEKFLADKSVTNLMELREKVAPYHPQTVTKDTSTMAALTSPILGVDDARWYLLELATLRGDTTFEQLMKPLNDEMFDFNALENRDEYQMPVLLISGSCDWTCPVDWVEEYADAITAPRKELYLVEGCGHSPQGQVPEEFCNAVEEFLGR